MRRSTGPSGSGQGEVDREPRGSRQLPGLGGGPRRFGLKRHIKGRTSAALAPASKMVKGIANLDRNLRWRRRVRPGRTGRPRGEWRPRRAFPSRRRGVVSARLSHSESGAGRSLASDQGRAAYADRGADWVGQDAGRLSRRDRRPRSPGPRRDARRRDPGRLRLPAEGAQQRHPPQPGGAPRRHKPRTHARRLARRQGIDPGAAGALLSICSPPKGARFFEAGSLSEYPQGGRS